MKPRDKSYTIFICESCGNTTTRWEGRCPSCREWNSLTEAKASDVIHNDRERSELSYSNASRLSEIPEPAISRISFSSGEINRVLGGGVSLGSLILLAGDPGIGKSTVLLQMASDVGKNSTALYATGEESAGQVKLRADRLRIRSDGLYVLPANRIEQVIEQIRTLNPSLVIIDSIQTLADSNMPSEPGSISQIRACTRALLREAKTSNIPMMLSGHVTKGGDIAGPRLMEHMVDVVLYLEGDSTSTRRLLRSVKNRFGSTNELGVFEMTPHGLDDVDDPSATFIAGRTSEPIGSVLVSILEGTRPLMTEMQALTSSSILPSPRRVASGSDINRMHLVCAVLERELGINLRNQDVMLNLTGGLRVFEPAVDLSIALSIASSVKNAPLISSLVVTGEIGLNGEIRSVPQVDLRVAEADRLGLKRIIIPENRSNKNLTSKTIDIVAISNLRQAFREALLQTG